MAEKEGALRRYAQGVCHPLILPAARLREGYVGFEEAPKRPAVAVCPDGAEQQSTLLTSEAPRPWQGGALRPLSEAWAEVKGKVKESLRFRAESTL